MRLLDKSKKFTEIILKRLAENNIPWDTFVQESKLNKQQAKKLLNGEFKNVSLIMLMQISRAANILVDELLTLL